MFQRLFGGFQEETIKCESPDGALHVVISAPCERPRVGTLIMVPPDGEERSFALRPMVNCARALAAAGYTVVRFDFMGQGLSDGEYDATSFASRVDDLKRVWDLSSRRFTSHPVGILAVRLGAAVAIAAVADLPDVQRLVLWEPILDTTAYLHTLLRVTVATQMVAFGKVTRDRSELIEAARGGELISVNGFNLSGAFIDELLSVDLFAIAERWNGKAFGVGAGLIPPRWQGLPQWQFMKVPSTPFWREPKVHVARPPVLLEPTLTWLNTSA